MVVFKPVLSSNYMNMIGEMIGEIQEAEHTYLLISTKLINIQINA